MFTFDSSKHAVKISTSIGLPIINLTVKVGEWIHGRLEIPKDHLICYLAPFNICVHAYDPSLDRDMKLELQGVHLDSESEYVANRCLPWTEEKRT